MEDVFEPVYTPRKIEFWLEHWEELETLVHSPKSSAHIAEHLNREWVLLQVRLLRCLCYELHDADSRALDPGCRHEPSGGSFRTGTTTALCIMADLKKAAEALPAGWSATHKIWRQQMMDDRTISLRARHHNFEREPIFARDEAVRRMARQLGWSVEQSFAS